eukprot:m.818623 g.818623  ORF g.818623 m.818623 type:complete len:257 (-) comp23394_c0_seq189:1831-2601(-)
MDGMPLIALHNACSSMWPALPVVRTALFSHLHALPLRDMRPHMCTKAASVLVRRYRGALKHRLRPLVPRVERLPSASAPPRAPAPVLPVRACCTPCPPPPPSPHHRPWACVRGPSDNGRGDGHHRLYIRDSISPHVPSSCCHPAVSPVPTPACCVCNCCVQGGGAAAQVMAESYVPYDRSQLNKIVPGGYFVALLHDPVDHFVRHSAPALPAPLQFRVYVFLVVPCVPLRYVWCQHAIHDAHRRAQGVIGIWVVCG